MVSLVIGGLRPRSGEVAYVGPLKAIPVKRVIDCADAGVGAIAQPKGEGVLGAVGDCASGFRDVRQLLVELRSGLRAVAGVMSQGAKPKRRDNARTRRDNVDSLPIQLGPGLLSGGLRVCVPPLDVEGPPPVPGFDILVRGPAVVGVWRFGHANSYLSWSRGVWPQRRPPAISPG